MDSGEKGSHEDWVEVDRYVSELLRLSDDTLEAALARSRGHGLPDIQISHPQGQLLYLLARATRARRVLEVGTLGGFSTIFLARAVQPGGVVYTLERDATHAAVARENLKRAGVDGVVELMEGDAHASLATMIRDRWDPFDFVFLDAEKTGYASYLEAILQLARRGTLIVADNVVRRGEVLNADSGDANIQGIREFNAALASNPKLGATVLQTVGTKGYDGLAIALVTE